VIKMLIRRGVVLLFFFILRVIAVSQNDTINYIDFGDKHGRIDLLYPYFHIVRFESKNEINKSRFHNKLFNDDLVKLIDNNSLIVINPLIELGYGYNVYKDKIINVDKRIYDNVRGVWVRGSFNEKVFFSTTVMENTSKFPFFKEEYVKKKEVIPGKASYKQVADGELYDYGFASGYFMYIITKNIFIQGGQDKLFIGNGSSSLVLSENSNNYPFVRLGLDIKNIQYNVIYAKMYDLNLNEPFESRFHQKYANIYSLSYKFEKKLNISIFESILYYSNSVYNIKDGIPLIGYHILENQINKYFYLVGGNIVFKNKKNNKLYYMQYVTNGKWNKGIQVGVKSFNTFNINNLNINLETVAKSNNLYGKNQEYMNYNQYLGYPDSANYNINIDLNYIKHRFVSSFNCRYIFIDNANNKYIINSFFAGFEINKSSKLTLGIEYGNLLKEKKSQEHVIMVKLRTSIERLYNEFASFL